MDIMEEVLQAFNGVCMEMRLTISTRKTKILAVFPVNSHSLPPKLVSLVLLLVRSP